MRLSGSGRATARLLPAAGPETARGALTFYHLLVPLAAPHPVQRLRYLTFRSLMAWSRRRISLVVGPWLVRRLRTAQYGGKTIRQDMPARHRQKQGTPPLGASHRGRHRHLHLLWANLLTATCWAVVLTTLGIIFIGMWDDCRELPGGARASPRDEFGLQLLFALVLWGVVFWEPARDGWQPVLAIPFLKGWLIHLGGW